MTKIYYQQLGKNLEGNQYQMNVVTSIEAEPNNDTTMLCEGDYSLQNLQKIIKCVQQ